MAVRAHKTLTQSTQYARSADDLNPGTLRDALTQAAGAGATVPVTITIGTALRQAASVTITLASKLPAVNGTVSIDGGLANSARLKVVAPPSTPAVLEVTGGGVLTIANIDFELFQVTNAALVLSGAGASLDLSNSAFTVGLGSTNARGIVVTGVGASLRVADASFIGLRSSQPGAAIAAVAIAGVAIQVRLSVFT